MRNVTRTRPALIIGAAALFALALVQVLPAAAPTFATAAFQTQWNAAEATVPNFWGPPLQLARDGQNEPYVEGKLADGTTGQRLVQYFDKARMEQTTASGPVTNGLLTVELISGRRQIGDNAFSVYPPSNSPVAGDPGDSFLTYKILAALPAKIAQDTAPVSRVLNPDGTFGTDAALGADTNAAFGSYQGDPGGQYGHNIPAGMWTYLQGLPVAWLNTMGFPITEAFWARVKVGGTIKPVMVQPFQRRVLTYTPGNPQGFLVEMGNIGQHYFQWRYTTARDGSNVAPTTAPTATPTGTTPAATATTASSSIVFVSALGAHPGSATNLTIKTTPGATCTLDYKAPGETASSRAGNATVADKDGMVTWSFAAGGNEKHPFPKGQGLETVTCNGVSATNSITIG